MRLAIFGLAGIGFLCASGCGGGTQRDDGTARAAFLDGYRVLTHPRCLNCHPAGEVPLQGDDSHLHLQGVKRGTDGKGRFAAKCAGCHQEANLAGENMPPGVPGWHMPGAEMPMVFEGRSAAQLCRQLKDPRHNGGKSVEGAIEHLERDPLVLWAWDPGDGRSSPPMSHADFVRTMRSWVTLGAACPD